MEYTDDENDDYADEYYDEEFGDDQNFNEDDPFDPGEHNSDQVQSSCGESENIDGDTTEGKRSSAELCPGERNAGESSPDRGDTNGTTNVEKDAPSLNSLDAEITTEKCESKQCNNKRSESNNNPVTISTAPDGNDIATEDLRKKIWEASRKLVVEGEKNVNLALQVEQSKDELKEIKKEIEHFRNLLLQGVNGGISDVKNYAHVSLGELLRIRLQENDQRSTAPGETRYDTVTCRKKVLKNDDGGTQVAGKSIEGVQKLERDLALKRQRNDALERKCASLKDELNAANKGFREVKTMKRKMAQMVERSRHEREMKVKAEREIMTANERVEALSDHIEKLMIHLKHEAISKARALAEQARKQREVELLKARNQKMTARNTRKDRVILELKEGGKILEDQLRLMDEKYIELRTKLDWTRTHTERTIRKKEEEIRQLRAKFALFTELMPDEKMAAVPLLDEYDFGVSKTSESVQQLKNKSHKDLSGSILGARERGIT